MANSDVKKFIVYSLFMGILIIPMVGLPSSGFEITRALLVWGVFVAILAFWLLSKTIRRINIIQRAARNIAPLRGRVSGNLAKVPTKIYLAVLLTSL